MACWKLFFVVSLFVPAILASELKGFLVDDEDLLDEVLLDELDLNQQFRQDVTLVTSKELNAVVKVIQDKVKVTTTTTKRLQKKIDSLNKETDEVLALAKFIASNNNSG